MDSNTGPEPSSRYLVVVSEADPVARAVAEAWGTPPAIGEHVDGAPVRQLSSRAWMLRRAPLHIHDDRLDERLPPGVRAARPTFVFPSIHRSAQNVHCLTVHPLGNPGSSADVGGRPGVLVPTDPRRMTDALRRLSELGQKAGWTATYEATHHGPELRLPAMFVEVGYGAEPAPPPEAVRVLTQVVPHLSGDARDRIALAVGGGHYAPHFTDLALKRHWAFGHILSRHALSALDPAVARSAFDLSEGAQTWLSARTEDAAHPALVGLGTRGRDSDAPTREQTRAPATDASGT